MHIRNFVTFQAFLQRLIKSLPNGYRAILPTYNYRLLGVIIKYLYFILKNNNRGGYNVGERYPETQSSNPDHQYEMVSYLANIYYTLNISPRFYVNSDKKSFS
jgi:hypothetical protein